jgi:hypothetical protein
VKLILSFKKSFNLSLNLSPLTSSSGARSKSLSLVCLPKALSASSFVTSLKSILSPPVTG